MTKPFAFGEELIQQLGDLRAFAMRLCGNATLADDLVQETCERVLRNADTFQPGTNFRAWLFTVTRNTYYTVYRKRKREVQDSDGTYASSLSVAPAQEEYLALADLERAINALVRPQRDAILEIAVQGHSYEEVSTHSGTPVGTIKSRISRARIKLKKLLDNPSQLKVLSPPAKPTYSAQRTVAPVKASAGEDLLFAGIRWKLSSMHSATESDLAVIQAKIYRLS